MCVFAGAERFAEEVLDEVEGMEARVVMDSLGSSVLEGVVKLCSPPLVGKLWARLLTLVPLMEMAHDRFASHVLEALFQGCLKLEDPHASVIEWDDSVAARTCSVPFLACLCFLWVCL